MKENDIVKFVRQRDYKFVKNIDRGGLGEAVLLKDEVIDENFVCKKYSPVEGIDKTDYFINFVREIKLLHLLYNKNVVRVFNYHLFPEQTTGYILMEFINGSNIQVYLNANPDKVNDIFIQTIEGFSYLESNGILHRDIRPQNILVSNDGIVKIIDFGFGKKVDFNVDFVKTITLNWAFNAPDEFNGHIYDFRTEVYFVGRLFEKIIVESKIEGFAFDSILRDMILDYDHRIESFFNVSRRITEKGDDYDEFTDYEKSGYRHFADALVNIFGQLDTGATYKTDLGGILKALTIVYQNSILEEDIQNGTDIANCFINGGYTYRQKMKMPVVTLKWFLEIMQKFSIDKRKIILTHLWKRLDTINRKSESDDLPF
jgi:eukaryotic-like serine/threonine-protein kinase